MEKVIKIGEKDVRMRVSARIPFDYRHLFGKDIIREMQKMTVTEGIEDFELFEKLAWLMAKYAGEKVYAELPAEEAVAAWLDTFDSAFDIVSALPEIMELWQAGLGTLSTARKK